LARRQLSILRNEQRGSRSHSEFYPYRYLADEGFLPGYNFTRLPVRAFLPTDGEGEYFSRRRQIALQEFGPRNLIYHNGAKFEVWGQQTVDIEKHQVKAKVATSSGYFLKGDDFNRTHCPFTGASVDENCEYYHKLIELSEVRTSARANITCEEEERTREGYDIRTYFSVDGSMDDIQTLDLNQGDETLLTIQYIPTSRLYFVNTGWRYYRQKGFVIETKTGVWKKSPNFTPTPEEKHKNPVERVKIYTHDVADALYIRPLSALNLNPEGITTLRYALQKAIISIFQVERSEIASELMGETKIPNIMIYEAAAGSLGILSQITENPDRFRDIIQEAYTICYFDNPEKDRKKPPASYDDLLSYYNQRHHSIIDRHLIRDALEMLKACTPVVRPGLELSYEKHYETLFQKTDPLSKLERSFLKHLYKHRLRLPDKAQYRIPDLYIQPDFFYEPNVVIFVDGSVHDKSDVRMDDLKKRRKLRNDGYRVVTYYYRDDLNKILKENADIFRKIS